MIPPSPWLLLGAALVVAGAYVWGRHDGAAPAQAKLERERTAWANERTKAAERAAAALASEIAAHNRTANELEALHDSALAARAIAERQIAAADAAASAAVRSASRLRDALATNRLATDAARGNSASDGRCQAAVQAADLLRVMLGRTDELAGRIGDAALATSRFADESWLAGKACESAYETVKRNSGVQ